MNGRLASAPEGDAQARVAAMVNTHGPALLRVAQRLSLCSDDANDALQRALDAAGQSGPKSAITLTHSSPLTPPPATPPPAPTPEARKRASLAISSARLSRTRLGLALRGPLDSTAAVTITYRAEVRGRLRAVRRRMPLRDGRLRLTIRIPKKARARRARLVVAFPGDARYLPSTVQRKLRRR